MDSQHPPTPPAVPPAFGGTGQSAPRRMIRSTTALGLALALGVGSFGAGYALVHHGTSAQTATSATPTAPSNAEDSLGASTSADKGMVEITSKLPNGAAAGTGMILTAGGIVVTNHHVVAGATQIQVTVVSTGQTYTARYLRSDSTKDVALLQLVGASNLQTVGVDASGVKTGDKVTALRAPSVARGEPFQRVDEPVQVPPERTVDGLVHAHLGHAFDLSPGCLARGTP
ncbi:MAG: trypsin-like peptidase domain-containing protein [Actinomycetales bacterium]